MRSNLIQIAPEIIIFLLAITVLLIGLLPDERKKTYLVPLSISGVIIALVFESLIPPSNKPIFGRLFLMDYLAVSFKILFLIIAAYVMAMSVDLVTDSDYVAEYCSLILFATLGSMVLASSVELILMYVGLGLLSLSSYSLVTRSLFAPSENKDGNYKSKEAGIKYILLGMVSAAALLYGLSIVYGLTGTLVIKDIYQALTGPVAHPALIISFAFVLMGFGFKIGMVPFHMWVPDTYEGAPTPIAAFLSVGSKAAGFALLLRVFIGAFAGAKLFWVPIVEILAVSTMFLGNLVALSQTNIKRLLAYSSIAHGGYILVGIAALSNTGVSSILFYLLAYTFTNLCAFTAVIAFSSATGSDEIKDYAGLYQRAPGLAFALAVSMLSLGGIPVLAGFVAKFYIFAAAVNEGLYWLVALALVNSAIALYYYFGVIRQMYFLQPTEDGSIRVSASVRFLLWSQVAAIIMIGIYPWFLIRITEVVSKSFLAGL